MSTKGQAVVFIGNVAYGVTEEQLKSVFGQCGRIQSLRLVVDRDSGRPRGYGFCEFADRETAASAVRNLNGYEIDGRALRVDFSDSDSGPSRSSQPEDLQPQQPPPQQQQQMVATDAITQIIGSLNANQLFDVMSQMKALVVTNPDQARSILMQAPQISYALFQAMVIMKVITPQVIQHVLQSSLQQPQQPLHQYQQHQHGTPHPGSAPPQVPQQQQPAGSVDLSSFPVEQQAALKQILDLTEAQIAALPAMQKQQVLTLRQQLLVGSAPMQQQQQP